MEQFGAKSVRNGTHDPERGKFIGIEHATGEYLFFIDDDNTLTHKTWLENLVRAVVDENCVGGRRQILRTAKKQACRTGIWHSTAVVILLYSTCTAGSI